MHYLITGGTGSLGRELVKVFTKEGHDVTILSRDPHKQASLINEYPMVRAILADVRDYASVLNACRGVHFVVHAAALKRVELGETNPDEYFSVNVGGTRNVAEAAATCDVRHALLISTDKAPAPANLYGVTKKLAESVWLNKSNGHTAFSAVRYGNVMDSNGGVWSVWQERIKRGLPLVVREPEPTRFCMRKVDAVALVRSTLLKMQGGEIFVPYGVPAFSLWNLAREMEPDEDKWIIEPLGPGEKQHEILVAPTEYVEKAYDDVWRVLPRRTVRSQCVPMIFQSERARRLTGAEVVKLLEGT